MKPKNVKKTETHFDWMTLILNQTRSILPKAYKRNFNALFSLFTMKAFKFLRGLYGKKEKKDRRKEMEGWENRFFSRAGGSFKIRGDRGDGGSEEKKKVQSPLRVF